MLAAEARIPALAAKAGRAAHRRALQETGAVVMKSAEGDLVEMKEDGTVRILKPLPAGTPVRVGQVLRRVKAPKLVSMQ